MIKQTETNQSAFALLTVLLALLYLFFPPDWPYVHASGSDLAPVPKGGSTPSADSPALLTLERALETALLNNPDLAAASWDVAASASRLEIAKSARWPVVSAEGAYQRFLDEQRLIAARYNGELGVFDDDISRGDIVLRLPLFTGGRTTHEIGAAKLLNLSEQKKLVRTREELVFNVSALFHTILAQGHVVRSVGFSIRAMEEQERRVIELLRAQKAARVDLLRTQVRLADLRQNLVREENILAVARRALANVMGMEQGDLPPVQGALTYAPYASEPLDALLENARKRRADYLAAQARLAAQKHRMKAAGAGHWPNVHLVGSYGVRAALNPEDEGTDTKNVEDAGVIGIALTLPLFEGGRVISQVNQEQAVLRAEQERLRALELKISQEVEVALLEIRSGSKRVEAMGQAVEQARESLRIERMKYDLGSGSITDVFDAQSALLGSESNYYRALADYRIALARLRLATGDHPL